MATPATKGSVPKKAITALLLKGGSSWIALIPGSFDIVEINFLDDAGTNAGGVVGIKFAAIGMSGRPAWIFTTMDSVAGIQVEQPVPPAEPTNG